MKAKVFDIKRFSVHDGPGIRQTIFFKGCPLNCWWCHNPESQELKSSQTACSNIESGKKMYSTRQIGNIMSLEQVMHSIRKDEMYYDESGGGVTFSGGEPLMQHQFVLALAQKCKKEHIHTALDTTGYTSTKVFESFLDNIDLFLFDLKHLNSNEHEKFTGVGNERILSNLSLLSKNSKKVIIRFPVIPTVNDSRENINEMKNFLLSLENIRTISLLPYHEIANHKYERFDIENKMHGIKALEEKDIYYLKKEFTEIGFKVSIGG